MHFDKSSELSNIALTGWLRSQRKSASSIFLLKCQIIVEPNPVELLRRELAQTPLGDMAESLALLKQNQQQQQQQQQQPQQQQQQQTPDHMNPLSLMQAISSAQRNQGSSQPQTSREMTLPAGLVAALVARNKLAEIRGVIRSRTSTKKSFNSLPISRHFTFIRVNDIFD